MPRFFKSPSGKNGISLNSPGASSSQSKGFSFSREERIEEARRERDAKSKKSSGNSRRRNFGFLKSGIGRTEKSSSDKHAISRRREHAKQLANLAYSDDPTSIATTTTSASTTDSHFAYNMSTTIISPVNNNNNNNQNTSFFDQPYPANVEQRSNSKSSRRSNNNMSSTSNNVNDAFGSSDPFASFDAFGVSSSSKTELTAKDFSELDFFASQLGGATTPVRQAKKKQQHSSSKKNRKPKSQPVSLDHFFTEDDAMSMSSNHTSNERSTIDNGGASVSNSVAARRRMRSHMRRGNSDADSVSSYGSMASSSLEQHSFPPPPAPSSSLGSPGIQANRKNRVSSNKSPFRSSGSATSSTATYSASSPGVNLFDSDTENGAGFTFDAFGLDESQVEREVNDAMQDILGNGGFSIFVDKNGGGRESGSESGHGSGNNSVGSGRNSFSRQDSFSGHQTDASEESFGAQNWDTSSNPSRNPSPVPPQPNNSSRSSRREYSNDYQFTKNGFADGFQASPVTPKKTAVQLSSVQQRRLQRSAQRGGVNSTAMTPPTGNNNLRQISSEPPAKTKTTSTLNSSSGFSAQAFDNPWKDDPFASSDDGGRFSDFFGDKSVDDNTARRLYADTQSDVHDYYPSGSMTAAAHSLLDAATPEQMAPNKSNNVNDRRTSFSDARSDVGVSGRMRLSYESTAPASPAADLARQARAKAQSSFFELPPEEGNGNQSESDQSDDMDQMQDDLAHEFAKDIVRRISPSGASQASSQHSRSSKKSTSGSVHSYRSHYTTSNREETSRRIQYGEDRIDESESDDQAVQDSNPQHSKSRQFPSQSSNNNRQINTAPEPTAKRFGSFRSRYEARTRGGESSPAISEVPTPTMSNSKSDVGRSYSYGSLRSSYDKAKSSQSISNEPKSHESTATLPKWQQPLSGDSQIEEKKEEERSVHSARTDPPPRPRNINSLKARWEAKSRGPVAQSTRRPSPKSSEVWKDESSMLDQVLDQVERESPPKKFNDRVESKSDIGSSPSYLSNVRLRKVASPAANYTAPVNEKNIDSSAISKVSQVTEQYASAPPVIEKPIEKKMTYRERREMELRLQREQDDEKKAKATAESQPAGKKLNYRERRELELRKQREEEEKAKIQSSSQSTPNTDVASLIRKRISANKAKTNSPPQDSHASRTTSSLTSKPGNATEMKENHYGGNDSSKLTEASHNRSENFKSSSYEQHSLSRSNTAKVRLTAPTGGDVNNNEETESDINESPRKNPAKMLENMLAARAPPPVKRPSPEKDSSPAKPPHQMLENFLSAQVQGKPHMKVEKPNFSKPDVSQKVSVPDNVSQSDAKSMLSGFLAKRGAPPALSLPVQEDNVQSSPSKDEDEAAEPTPQPSKTDSSGLPALKDDPKFERYFRMLKMGLPLDVAKHAMVRDGLDPSILDLDHNKPLVAGVPLKDDPKYQKYFRMLKIGISIEQVKHSMERDGLNPDVMDQDRNLPVMAVEKKQVKKKKEMFRRARLHWKAIKTVVKNSLWEGVQHELGGISIDEDEFNDLFQADLKASKVLKTPTSAKKGAAIRVIESKRANNGGIILARVKLTHDQMADAVDRMDASSLTAEQIENVIEYLPTRDERDALEKYMLEGGQDAAEKFDGLCECEKFMVSMMTVKHAKRKIRALLFKLQFMTCMESIAKDAQMIDTACDELINSNRLRQLLGIILQFGNRLNTAGNSSKTKAGGFSLESLSKLSQAKAFDKKTTFLHYIILIVERNNELLLKYYDDIPTALEADSIFWDQCQQDLEEVENQLENVRRIALHEARSTNESMLTEINDDDSLGEMELTLEEEVVSLRATKTGLFTLSAIKQVSALREKIERTKAKCVRLKTYFGVTSKATEPQEIFSVFVNFTRDFQKAKEQVFSTAHKRLREDRKKARQKTPTKAKTDGKETFLKASSHQPNMNKLFSDIQQRQPSNTRQDSQSEVQSSRAGLLSSIKERQSPSEKSSPSPRASLMNSITQRKPPSEGSATPSRAGLMDAIKQRNPASESSAPSPRAGLMDAIKQRKPPSESNFSSPRAGLMDAIKQRKPASESGAPVSSRAGLMDAIKQQNPGTSGQTHHQIDTHISAMAKTTSMRSPRDAIRNRRRIDAVRTRYGN